MQLSAQSGQCMPLQQPKSYAQDKAADKHPCMLQIALTSIHAAVVMQPCRLVHAQSVPHIKASDDLADWTTVLSTVQADEFFRNQTCNVFATIGYSNLHWKQYRQYYVKCKISLYGSFKLSASV